MFQINLSTEIQFIYYYIAVLLGAQVAIYTIYLYFKNKDTYLKLNRVLLSYALYLIVVLSGAFLLLINRIFLFSSEIQDFLSKGGFILVMSAPIGYSVFLKGEEFSKIRNSKLLKILIYLNLIPIFTVIILGVDSPIFRITIVFMAINSLYIMLMQLRLIKISLGNIKTRLRQFLVGEILGLVALALAAMIPFSSLPIPNEIFFFLGTSLLISGLFIIFISIYDFPAFYEFEWREYLERFYVIYPENNTLLYYRDFLLKTINIEEERFYSGEIIGLERLIMRITEMQSQGLNMVKHGDSLILLEHSTKYSNPLIFVLIVKRELECYSVIIKTLQNQFESFFKEILGKIKDIDMSNSKDLFFVFDTIINNFLRE